MLHRSLPPSFLPFLSQIVPIIVPFDDFRRCKFTASRELSGNFKSTISTIVQLVNKFRLDNERSIAFLNSNYIYLVQIVIAIIQIYYPTRNIMPTYIPKKRKRERIEGATKGRNGIKFLEIFSRAVRFQSSFRSIPSSLPLSLRRYYA